MNSKSVKEGGKHNMYSKSKRFIASFLAVLMAVCMLPAEMLGVAGVAYAAATPADVSIKPDNGATLNNETEVTLTCDTPDVEIRYTTDGTEPNATTSSVYDKDNKFKVNPGTDKTVTVKAVAVATDDSDSTPAVSANVASATYTFKVADVTVTEPSGTTVTTEDTIKLGCNTEGASIVYSIDGTAPSLEYTSAGIALTGVSADFTLQAKATKDNYADSEDLSVPYTFSSGGPTVTAPTNPTATPASGAEVKANDKIKLSSDVGAEIYYVVNTTGDANTAYAAVKGETDNATKATALKAMPEAEHATVATAEAGVEVTVPAGVTAEGGFSIMAVAENTAGVSTVVEFTYTVGTGTVTPPPSGDKTPATLKLDFNSDRFVANSNKLEYNDGYFSFKHDKDGTIKSGTLSAVDAGVTNVTTGTKYKYYNTQGKTTEGNNARAIRFTPTSDAVVTVGAAPKSTGTTKLGLLNPADNKIGDTNAKTMADEGKVYELTFNVTGDGATEYAVGTDSNAFIYYVIVQESDYEVKPPAVIGDAPGAVQTGSKITLNAPEGYDIYWAIGDTVTIGTDTKYDGSEITIDTAKTITAVSKQTDGDLVSEPATFVYTIAKTIAKAPVPSKSSGIYTEAQSITLTSDTANATIKYTTDGSNPIGNDEALTANGDITVDKTQVIKAYAVSDDTQESPVVTLTYIIKHSVTNKKYTLKMSDEEAQTSPKDGEAGYGNDISLGTEGYYKILVEDGKSVVDEIGNISGTLADNSIGKNYDITKLTGWPTEEAGTLAETSKVLTLTGAKIQAKNGKVINAAKLIVSADKTKVTAYYADKKTSSTLDVYKASVYDDSALGTKLTATDLTYTPEATSTPTKMCKVEFEATAGIYYLGFSDNGGIIPYMEVIENYSTTTPPADTVKAPTFNPTVAADADSFVYTFSTTEGSVEIEAEDGTVYYVLSTDEETKYNAFVDDAETTDYTSNGTAYTDEIPVTDGMIIKAVAIKDGKASKVATSPEYKLGNIATLTGTVTATPSPENSDITVGDTDVKVNLTYTKATDGTEDLASVKFLYTVSTDESVEPAFSDLPANTPASGSQTGDSTTDIEIPATAAGKVYVKVLAHIESTTDNATTVTALASTPASFEYTVKSVVTPPAMPTATVNGKAIANNGNETVTGSATVALASDDNADIYYTDNGNTPDSESTHYENSFTVTETKTIKAIAIKEGVSGEVLTFTVTVETTTPGDDNEGDEENEENWYWDEDKDEIKRANNGKIPEGLWMAGLYQGDDSEWGYSYNAGLKVTPHTDWEIGDYGIRVYYHTHLLTYKTDYTVSYKNNVNAAKADAAKAPTITISGKGSYSGKVSKTFTINPTKLSWIYDYECSSYVLAKKGNKAQQVIPTITDEGYDSLKDKEIYKKLKNKKDFDLVYYNTEEYNNVIKNNTGDKRKEELAKIAKTAVTDPGAYKVVATGKGNYEGTKTFNVTVLASDAKLASKLKVTIDKVKYDKAVAEAAGFKGFEPKVTVKDGKNTLTALAYDEQGNATNEADADYRISYNNNTAAGMGYVTISPVLHTTTATDDEGKATTTTTQTFYDTRYVSFKISGTPIKSAKVTYDGDLTFKSDSVIDSSKIKVTYKNNELKRYAYDSTAGKYVGDYSIDIYNNYSAGKATVYIAGHGEYEGTLVKTFKIAPYDISSATVTLANTKEEEAGTLKAVFSKGGCYPEVVVKCTFGEGDNARTVRLYEGEDYTISYKNNNNFKKTAEIIIKGKGDYKGTCKKTFAFEEKSLSTLTMSVPDVPLLTKAGKYGSKPVIIDKSGVKVVNLAVKKDYTLEYYDVTPKSTEPEPAPQTDEGTGEGTTTTPVTEGTKIDNINKFTATKDTVIKVVATAVSGSGYKESISATYKVHENDFNKVTVKINPQVYAGKAVILKAEDITVTPKGGSALAVKASADSAEDGYYIDETSYVNNDKKGTAKVTLIGTGSYAGSKTVTFKITPRKMEWAALTPGKVEETVETITNAIKGLFN